MDIALAGAVGMAWPTVWLADQFYIRTDPTAVVRGKVYQDDGGAFRASLAGDAELEVGIENGIANHLEREFVAVEAGPECPAVVLVHLAADEDGGVGPDVELIRQPDRGPRHCHSAREGNVHRGRPHRTPARRRVVTDHPNMV